jgi:hypothetical protein
MLTSIKRMPFENLKVRFSFILHGKNCDPVFINNILNLHVQYAFFKPRFHKVYCVFPAWDEVEHPTHLPSAGRE